MGVGKWPRILKLGHNTWSFSGPDFFLVLVLCHVNLKSAVSSRPQKSFFDFNEIWYVGRGRWLMHDDMQYDPIQGQGQGQG